VERKTVWGNVLGNFNPFVDTFSSLPWIGLRNSHLLPLQYLTTGV
jgi:hypothetical protein